MERTRFFPSRGYLGQIQKSFGAYMGSLFEDKRGNRKGFPPEVAAELVALKRYYVMSKADDSLTWRQVGKRG
jgi:hypothetical protein